MTTRLTPRQQQVYELAVQGVPYQDIARRMCVEYRTVRTYISAVSRRLGVRPPLKAWLDDVDLDRLSPRERQCVELSRRNLRPAEIAAELGIAYDTVHNHLRTARRKYRAGRA